MDQEQRDREIQATLAHIQALQAKSARRWRLDVTLPMLAAQGIALFVLGVFVGIGLHVLFTIAVGVENPEVLDLPLRSHPAVEAPAEPEAMDRE